MFFSVLSEAKAAELFFEPREISTTINSVKKVQIFISTEKNEAINAIDINIEYPVKFLKLKDWSNGNSIINLWIKEPKNNNGIFSFQGIIPGGYSEEKGLLMVLYFESLKEGDAEIVIKDDSLVLLNDGEGTEAKTLFSSAKIISKFSEEDTPMLKFTENIPPEPFTPIITRSDEIYAGNYFLIFSTQDKNSGIDYYEISEGNELFRIAQSPYLLKNQRLNEEIKVRAIDKAGNIRTEIIPMEKAETDGDKFKKEILFFSILLLLLIIIIVIFAKYLYNKNRKRK
ncbi:MAG: hypothetical protein P1P85_01075 [Patescibacteria group bacterium]|nr:hypothetical protein [Patescibacteria group bacterium]